MDSMDPDPSAVNVFNLYIPKGRCLGLPTPNFMWHFNSTIKHTIKTNNF